MGLEMRSLFSRFAEVIQMRNEVSNKKLNQKKVQILIWLLEGCSVEEKIKL